MCRRLRQTLRPVPPTAVSVATAAAGRNEHCDRRSVPTVARGSQRAYLTCNIYLCLLGWLADRVGGFRLVYQIMGVVNVFSCFLMLPFHWPLNSLLNRNCLKSSNQSGISEDDVQPNIQLPTVKTQSFILDTSSLDGTLDAETRMVETVNAEK